jgi:ankyrin repeat protein
MLVDEGCEYDAPNSEGITPIHMAARWRFPSVIQYLLKKGARFREDSILTTLMHSKTYVPGVNSTSTVIRMMLLHGADVNSVSNTGHNPLHILLDAWQWALDGDRLLEATEILVDAGCNFNTCNWKGVTPLQLAIARQDTFIINYFLRKGARIAEARYLYCDHLQWAVDLPWYSDAVEVAALRHSLTPNDIVRIKHMLCFRLGLPLGITRRILDIGEYRACASVIHRNILPSAGVSVCIPPIPFQAQLELSSIAFSVKFGM